MEVAYLHLVTNHIPIIGVPFAVALLAFGIWRKSGDVKTAAFLAFVLLGIATIGVYLLGQGGEDFVEDLRGVSHDAIEDHEEFAAFGLASVLAIAILSVFALLRYRVVSRIAGDDNTVHRYPNWIALTALILALVSTGVIGYTARLGGKIRHPEFHDGAQTNADSETNEADTEGENDGGRGRKRNRGER